MILEKNPLPFITGTICAHTCMSKCTRNFYERPVDIRRAKREAAQGGFEEVLAQIKEERGAGQAAAAAKKAAVVGGGPAGLAAAYFLARAGLAVTLFRCV